MRKSLLAALFSFLLSAFLIEVAPAQLTSLTEGFDTTGNSVPTPTGIFAQPQPWINVNNSDVPNTTAFNWEQGDSGSFIWTAQSPVGSTTSFAQVSSLSTNGTILSDWLLTPVLTLEAGATFSFYTVAVKGTTFANDLQVYISTSGSSTNVGSDAQTPTGGVFTLLPGGDLNPTLAGNGYPLTQPNGWTLETFTLTSAEIGAGTTGRIGLRYFIPNTAIQGSEIGVDTFSADPTVFTRTVSGNWTDTTGWTSNAVPNGTTVTAQLVNPGSGANNVNLGGGTFTVNQLQFSGTNAGTWNVTNGTIVFDGTSPTFLNQGDSNGLVGSLPNLTLNATTTFEIDNASAVTDVTGAVTGTGGLIKTGSGTLTLTGTNTYSGGTTISAGTLQIGNGGTSGSITGNVTDNGTLAFDRSDAVTFGGGISGTGGLVQLGSGTLILTGVETFTGGTIVDAGTLQLGDGIHTTSLAGANGSNGSPGGAGTDAVTVNNSATFNVMTNASVSGGAGGDSAGLTHPGNGGEAVSFSAGGSLTNRGTISGGAGGAAAQIANGGNGGAAVSFSAGGSLTNSGTISGGAAGTKGPFGGVNGTAGFGVLFSGAAGTLTNESGGIINGGVMMDNFANAVTLDTGSVINGILNIGTSTAATLTLDGTGTQLYSAAVTGATTFNGTLVKNGTGTWTLDESFTDIGGTVVNAGTLQVGNGIDPVSLVGSNGSADAVTVNNNAVLNVMAKATISGGNGGSVGAGSASGGAGAGKEGVGGNGGAAVSFTTGGSLTNSGTISGGNGGDGSGPFAGGNGGEGVSFSAGGSLTNSGTISGGSGGTAGAGVPGGANGIGGYGVVFTGAAGTLTNESGGIINGGVMMDNFANAVTLDTGSVINGILNIGTSTAATLTLDGTGTQLYSAAVTGATTFNGTLVKNGTGTWTLDESFTDIGGTVVNAGTLQVGNGIDPVSLVGSNGSADAVTVNNNAVLNVMAKATISGGNGGSVGAGSASGGAGAGKEGVGGNGGAAVSFTTGGSLTNSGTISGGNGGDGSGPFAGGNGGAAVSFSAGDSLTNSGTISGGAGGGGGNVSGGAGGNGGNGGEGVSFSAGGSLTNSGTISGGSGGTAGAGVPGGANGIGGYGVVFTGAAGTLTNESGGIINGGVMMDNFANAVTLDTGSVINGILNIGTSTAATLTLDGTGTQLYSAAVTGATTFNGTLVKNGTGTWTLDESFTDIGGTVVNAGTLQVGNGIDPVSLVGSNGSADAVTVNNNAVLNVMAKATISGGNGGSVGAGSASGGAGAGKEGVGGNGGAAVSFTTGGSLTNSGTISGGNGGDGSGPFAGGNGGAAVSFSAGDSLTNSGTISGGAGGGGGNVSGGAGGNGGNGGEGVSFSAGGSLTNSGTISGGSGGTAGAGVPGGANGIGGYGVVFTGAAGTLTNESGGIINGGVMMDNFANAVTLDTGSVINGILNIGTSTAATLTLDGTGTQLYSAAVTGATTFNGTLVKNGTGTWTLDESFTDIGGTVVNAGTLQVGNGIDPVSLVGSNGSADAVTVNNNAVLNVMAKATISGGNGGSVGAGSASGGAGAGKEGVGGNGGAAVSFTTGGSLTNSGTISGGNGGDGSGPFAGGNGGEGVSFSAGGSLTNSGTISGGSGGTAGAGVPGGANGIGGYGVVFTGAAGTLTNESGGIINGGVMMDNFANAVTLDTGSVINGILNIGTSTAATLTLDGTGTQLYSAAVTSATAFDGALIKNGAGTWTLDETFTYTGATTVNAGTLALGSGGSIALSSGLSLAASGAGFDISAGGNQTIQDLSGVAGSKINLGANTLTAGTADSTSFAGVISGTGGFTKRGTGTVTLSGANTYMGATTVDTGTLALGSGGSIASSSGLALATSGAGFDISAGGNQTIQDLSGVTGSTINLGANTLTAGTANSTSFAGVISGTGGFIKQGGGTLTLSGANTYMGATTVNAGTLALGSGGSIASSSGLSLAASGAGFDISAGGNQTIRDLSGVAGSMINLGANMLIAGIANSTSFAGVISGTGGFIKQGGGTLTLSGAETYSGATTVNAGTLALGSGGSIASSSGLALAISGAGFDISAGGNQTIQDLTGVAGSTINLGVNTLIAGTANSTSFAGVISGTGGFIKQGTGTLILTGNNTYSGGTSFNGGIVAVDNDGNLGTGALSFNAGTLEALAVGGGITSSKAITLDAGGGTFLADAGTTSTLSGVISGVGLLTKDGLGTLTLTGANIYTGGTTINAGTLQIGNGGTSGSIAGDVSDNATFAFNRSDSVTFGGVISGTGALAQIGSGTLTLTADNSYGGGTTINTGATLQLGNGGTTGSIIGNVNDNGSLIFNRSDNVTFNSLISGAGNLVQNGSGTTILGGANTYSGGTIINNGTLLVNNSRALGLGNVVVNGGTLGADPQPINVKGNYAQNAGGTLQLQVAGANPGQYDTLNVGGNAALGGTLQMISLGFQPNGGNQLTLVISGGTVSGRFARFVDPFSVRPGLNTIDLIFGKQSIVLEFLNRTTPVSPVIPTVPTVPTSPSVVPPIVIATINFSSFALTPNESAAANLLDAVQLNPRAADLISFLDKEPFANLPRDLNKISPDGLTAFYEISFSNANIQRLNLEGRMDDLHNGSNGFSSNMKLNGATVNPEEKASVDGKTSKAVVEPILQPGPENRWGVWVTGFGDFVSVDADANANGYNFTTGGVSLGIDYRITDQLAIGVMGEYSHTWTTLQPGGNIDVNSGRGGVYATWSYHGIYLDAAIYGGYNSYDSSRSVLGGLARGNTEGAELSTFISGGYDFHFGPLTVGPIAALQYTYAKVDGFSENGSLAPMQIQSDSVDSLRSDVGFRIFYQWQIGKILVEPSLKAAWEHEYLYSALPVTASFAGIPGPSATFFGPNEGHDSAIVSAGVSVQWTPMIATYVNYDGQLGRGNYDSNAVTGGVRISF